MQEDAKYYVPEMSEFFDGFEFQMQTINGFVTGTFPDLLEKNTELNQFKDCLMKVAHAITRVKFLDREDIEGEGWKRKEGFDERFEEYRIIQNNGDVYDLVYCVIPNSYRILGFDEFDGDCTLFYGKIKNRSELRKLMKQLEINTPKQ